MTISGPCPLLQVFDMPAALAFYTDMLGFAVVEASPMVDTPEGRFSHWMCLQRDRADVMLNTAYDEGERPARRPTQRWAGHADAGLYFGCDDVDALHRDLLSRGLDIPPPTDAPYGMRQLYLSAPDGYTLCFQQPAA